MGYIYKAIFYYLLLISEHEDLNVHMASLLSSGLEKLFLSIKNEDISNEVLLKLINCDRGGMQVFEQCGLLINIAHTMTVDLSLKGKLMKALEHENRTVSELREMFNQKELQTLELQSEVKRLQQVVQQVIHENKIGKCVCIIPHETFNC